MDHANCKGLDPELFFPEKLGPGLAPARKVCEACEVREACLEYALEVGERWGIWGGMSDKQRRTERRQRAVGPERADLIEARKRQDANEATRRYQKRQRMAARPAPAEAELDGAAGVLDVLYVLERESRR